MVLPSRLAAGGLLLLLAVLALGLDGKPLRQAPAAAAARLVRAVHPALLRLIRSQEPAGGGADRLSSNCFGHRLDRIGSVSGMGCGRVTPHPSG